MTQITITFDPSDEKELLDVVAFVNGVLGAEAVAPSTTTAKDEAPDTSATDAKKAEAAKKRKEATAKKKAEEEAAAAAAAEEEATSEFSRDDVRAKLKEYAALEGKDGAIQILKDNGAASITELAEDKFADVIEACG